MNENTHNWKNPVIAVVVLLIVGVAAYFYANRNKAEEELLTGLPVSEEVASVDGDLLRTLGQLRKLQLSDSIFSDPVWMSLQDFGRTLSSEPKGRQNPFAPLGR